MTDPPDVLVVVTDPANFATAVDAWRRVATVTQTLPPRLALAVLPPGAAPDVPGTRWYTDPPPDLPLSGAERLFVAGWQARRAGKERPGDGLPWDAPGYEPPDQGIGR